MLLQGEYDSRNVENEIWAKEVSLRRNRLNIAYIFNTLIKIDNIVPEEKFLFRIYRLD